MFCLLSPLPRATALGAETRLLAVPNSHACVCVKGAAAAYKCGTVLALSQMVEGLCRGSYIPVARSRK